MATAAAVAKLVVGWVGFVSGLIVIGVPGFTTFREIRNANDVGVRTVFPYATTWMNAAAVAVYAWHRSDYPVMAMNILGVVGESIYIYYYIKNSTGWRLITAYVMLGIQLAFAVCLALLHFVYFANGQHQEYREVVFGWLGAGTAILMYVSPAYETYDAIRHQNNGGLSLGLALAFLANAGIWTGYSLIDPFNLYYLIANGTGILSAIVQMSVWLYCYFHGEQQ